MNDSYQSIKAESQQWLARHIAIEAHNGQTRKITGKHYFSHCENVADRLARMGLDWRYIATAHLHDTAEDTDVSPNYLSELGVDKEVVAAVICLTKKNKESYMDYLKRVKANEIARAVKIADMLDNLADHPTNLGRQTSAARKDG